MIEFKNQFLHFDFDLAPCVLVLGERPGRQRYDTKEQKAFHGNRTGDFIEKICFAIPIPIILSNAYNYQVDSLKDIDEDVAMQDLHRLLDDYNICGIVCLGQVAHDILKKFMSKQECKLSHVTLEHPTPILRFNKDLVTYAVKLTSAIYEMNRRWYL